MKQQTKFKQTEIGMIPDDWEELKLSEAIEVNPKRELKKGVSAIKVPMDCLSPFYKKIQSFEVSKFSGGSKFINEDTLMARITPCLENGKTAFVDILKDDEVGFGSTEFIVLAGKNGKTTNDFVYYLSISPQLRKEAIKSMTGTSGRQRVQNDLFEEIELIIPSLPEQSAIAKILSSLDSKIELNQQMNKTLETIGQAIFKHWFIDFEFPNEKGKPYKSSGGEMVDSELGEIPKGWKVGKFKDISRLQMGISPKGDSYNEDGKGIPLLNGAADFSGKLMIPKKFTTEPIKKCNKGDLVFCIRATIGNVTFADKEFCLGRGVAALKINNDFREFFYYSLIGSLEKMISSATGSVIVGLSKMDIEDRKIIIPNDKLIKYFNNNLFSFFEMQKKLDEEIQSLSQIRDSLLPKLMSGKIRVPVEVNIR